VFNGEPTAVDGCLAPTNNPGLGIEVNRIAVEKLKWNGK
jgi:L-alanine-DL-glutamate epimerase-like enolase superfamily enzyme